MKINAYKSYLPKKGKMLKGGKNLKLSKEDVH